jgi:DNA polymerase-3 subunit delta
MAKKTKQLQKQNNLILVYGNQYTVDETIRRFRNQVSFDEVEKIDGESITIENLINSICNQDMFASKKLVIVREIPKEEADKLIDIFSRVPPSNYVLFYSYSSLKAKKKLCKYFSDYGKLIEYDTEVKNLDTMIAKMIEANGKAIDKVSLQLLTEYIGVNLGVIKSEIDKLCNYIGNRKKIEEIDIKEVCCLNREFVIWDLVSRIGEKNIAKAVNILASAIDSGFSYEFIILMLMRSIRLGIFLREMETSGESILTMMNKIKEYKKPNGTPVYGDYEIKKTYDSSQSFFSGFSLQELYHALKNCHNSFVAVRKSYKKEEQEKEVSMLLFEICFPSCFVQGDKNASKY